MEGAGMTDPFSYSDDIGPVKIIHVHQPSVGLKGILVVDNVAAGPSIGGMRMALDVSLQECFRLARAMTFKNAAAGLAHGGGKSVLFGDPHMAGTRKEAMIRAFAAALRDEQMYIFGPDMGTDEQCMAWVRDETGRAVGLPREVGGIPLDEIGATAWGVVTSTEVALELDGRELGGARIAIQGFGAVGKHAARMFAAKGAAIIAVADSRGAVQDQDGLDVALLTQTKEQGGSVLDAGTGRPLEPDAMIALDCDVWVPAARPDVISERNVERLKARLVVPGANIAATPGAESYLHSHDIRCVPDFIANAGGVICAALEYHGAAESTVFPTIEDKIRRNTRQVLEQSRSRAVPPRQAAETIARERVLRAMATRRNALFSAAPGRI